MTLFLGFFLFALGFSPETASAHDYKISNELNANNIRSIIQTEDGYLWVLAGQDVLRFDGVEFERFSLESEIPDDVGLYFQTESSEDLRIITNKGFWKFSGHRFTYVSQENNPLPVLDIKDKNRLADYGLSSGQIQAIIEDRKGFMWAGTKFGLDRLQKASNGQIFAKNYLKGMDVLSLFEDREGNIWVGTRASGLKCLRETAFSTYSVSNSAASNHFTSLLQDSKGRIWAGTRYGDLYRFEDGKFERVPFVTDIFDNIMFIMEEDNQGRILYGTEYRGIQVYENEKIRPYMTEDGPVRGTVVTLFNDSRGRLWVGSYTKELGFYEDRRYYRFLTSEEYPGKMVFSIIEDKRRNLWIGGTSGVLFLPNGSTDKQEMRWLLKDIPVHSLLEDDSGMIWCGTSDSGLIRIHPGTFATAKITKDAGLWTDDVYHILQDGRSNLWLTTYQRIIRVSLEDLNALADKKIEKVDCVVFGPSDGLPPPGLGGLLTQKGRLLFATNNGIAEVDPEAVPVNTVPPYVVVHKIGCNGQTLEIGMETESPLKIKSGALLEIHFKVITFKGLENIEVRYRLSGLEDAWTSLPPEKGRIVSFADLTPGEYMIQVSASNNNGIWNEEGASLSFQVVPSFYKTLYFKLLFFSVVIAAIVLVSVQVNKRAQKKKSKYRKTKLPDDLAEQYRQKLLFLLEKEKIYRDSSLCIKTLSRQMSLPAHHLSQVINEKFNKNFYELINGYRIEESIEMLADGGKDRLKILAVAYDVGFNNLSSFNRAFKRHTGKTPTEFKNGRQNRPAH